MPLAVRNSAGRRRKKPDEKLPERPGESTSAQVMAPTRMKLRVRRRDGAAGSGRPAEEEPRSQETGGRSSSRRKSASNTATVAPAAAASPPPSDSPPPPPPTSTATARTLVAAEDASPDSKCPICLDRFNNLAYLDRCLHRFCFPCIQEWSHNKAECPLCKQPFASILHSVRAEDDFKEYTLRPPPANSSVAATVAMVAAMASAARSDHQMRLMLRRHRTADGGETTTRRRRRERGGRASRRTGVWEWYLDSPRLPLPPLPHHAAVSPVVAEDSVEGEDLDQQRMRGVADLAEGVIFEGLTGLGAAGTHNVRASRRLMTRLVTRQRLQREGGTVRRLRERETVGFRRALYRCGIRVRGVAGVGGNQGPQCDITAESFRRNPTHLNRLRPWLRRELTVLYGAHSTLVDIVQRIIMAQLARHGLEDSPTIEEELRPFLLARTDHFLHELVNFARSPLSLENYDLQAAYEPPAAALELDGRSSPSDSSSVIAISEGEEEESWAGGRSEDRRQGRAGGAHNDVTQKRGFLTLSDWDDETPGPSYSTAEPSCSFSPAPQEAANEEEGVAGEEECLIVGYKKPIAERTPELVQLSSDTEEEEKEKTAEKPPHLLPTTPPPPSCLPTIPPSTSGAFPEEQDDKPKEKDDEQRSRARSWSASSGRSRESVCTLSPSERRQDGKQSGSEAAREKRRRKKRRKARDRSGTLFNPNRSIYPAMMCRRSRSPSPFHSSVESGSPLSLSPPDSSWEYRCSPLPSSVSSPSRSSSPLGFSPQQSSPQTPPTPSLSPADAHHGEKPGGKRKYKSRHLDSNNKDPTWRPGGGRHGEKGIESEGRGRREGQHGESSSSRRKRRRSREDRSPSVEIVYEGTVDAQAAQPPAAKRRRRRRRRRTQHSSSPVIITLDSDSSHDDDDLNRTTISSSSSPLSSQQTVDFSDLPPLPLVHSAGVGGALDGEIGELPADILDRGSDGSEAEAPGRSEDAVDDSDHDVDVEHDEDGGSPLRCDDDDDDDDGGGVSSSTRGPIGGVDKTTSEDGGDSVPTTTSDSRLLATILDDLRGIAAPRCDLSLNFDATKRRLRVRSDRGGWSTGSERTCNDAGYDLPTAAPPPPLHQMAFRVGVEAADVPPLLKQASPARSHHRNTPPPLKHKDAGSPHLSPADRLSPAPPAVDLDSSPASENRTIPPISSLRKHLPSSSAFRGFHSSRHKPPAGSRSPSASEKNSTGADSLPHLNSFHSPTEHSDEDTPPSALRAVNPSSPVVDVRSAESREEAARSDSTAARRSNEAPFSPGSCRAAPVDLRLFAGVTAGDKHAFSGVDSNNVSPPLLVSSVESRTRDLCPSDGLTGGAAAAVVNREDESPRYRSPPVDVHRSRPSPPANSLSSRSLTALTDRHVNANHVASPSAAAAFHASRPKLSSQSEPVDSDSTLHNHFGPVDPKLSVRDLVASAPRPLENPWDSNSNAIDARSDARSPGSVWTSHTLTHTVPRRTHK